MPPYEALKSKISQGSMPPGSLKYIGVPTKHHLTALPPWILQKFKDWVGGPFTLRGARGSGYSRLNDLYILHQSILAGGKICSGVNGLGDSGAHVLCDWYTMSFNLVEQDCNQNVTCLWNTHNIHNARNTNIVILNSLQTITNTLTIYFHNV